MGKTHETDQTFHESELESEGSHPKGVLKGLVTEHAGYVGRELFVFPFSPGTKVSFSMAPSMVWGRLRIACLMFKTDGSTNR